MARIRYLKPEFFTDEDLCNLPFETRIAFEGLWVHADKAGRLECRPKFLKAMIFPYDKVDIDKQLSTLSQPKWEGGPPFIQIYVVGVKTYIQILQWDKHQKPHHTEKESQIPEPPPLQERFPPTPLSKEKEIIMGMGMGNQLNPSLTLKNGELTVKEPLISNNGILTPEKLKSLFNEKCTNLKKIRELTLKRSLNCKNRIKEHSEVSFWLEVFTKANGIKLPPNPPKFVNGWIPDFDFLIDKPENPIKVIEGKYDHALQEKPNPIPVKNPMADLIKEAASKGWK